MSRLISMRERARLLGGTLNIHSQVGLGTHLDFAVPLSRGSEVAGY